MSRGVNKVILVGNLGKDPEATNSKSGMEIAKISVATMNKVKDASGEWKPETEWHRVVAFGSLAGIMIKYLKKGSKVYVEGRIKTNKWQDKEGQDRYTTEIIADQLQMLDGKSLDSSSPPSSYTENNSVIDDDMPF